MPAFLYWLLLPLALAGHLAWWLKLANWLNSTGLERRPLKCLTAGLHAGMLALAAAVVYGVALAAADPVPRLGGFQLGLALYLIGCAAIAVGPLLLNILRRLQAPPPAALVSNHSQFVDFRQLSEEPWGTNLLTRAQLSLPWNECLRVEVNEKVLRLAGLPLEMNGLAIAHLSDLHLTGDIRREFFAEAVRLVNLMEADVVALTGDLVDKACCLDWIPQTLGQVQARYGKYFVLGNHDRRVDSGRLRQLLTDAGWIDLGGTWRLLDLPGGRLLLAGNELPWFRPAVGEIPARGEEGESLRVLLSHSPDRIDWADARDIDLLLAGHTHGGQIRLPRLGAMVAPSRYGGRYAGGTFDRPAGVMHVSRGLGGVHPLRWNCPPELTRLVLTSNAHPQAEAG